jgi:hypothetical protein
MNKIRKIYIDSTNICVNIKNKELDLALYNMKECIFDDNIVFRYIVKNCNLEYISLIFDSNLLDLNKIDQHSLSYLIYCNDKNIFLYIIKYHKFDINYQELFLICCNEKMFKFINILFEISFNEIDTKTLIKGLLLIYINKNYKFPDFFNEYFLKRNISLDFNFKSLEQLLEKYSIYSFNILLKSVRTENLNYLFFILKNLEKIDFDLTYNKNQLLKEALLIDNIKFVKELLKLEVILQSDSLISCFSQVKSYKQNKSIEMANKIIIFSHF